MQDPSSLYSQMNAQVQHPQPQVQPFPEQEHLKCPRCDSGNTKFCYYNNYNLSQPRHFCKSCRRYWTKGGTLRNIPVGGGSRKNAKRSSASSSPTSSSSSAAAKRPALSEDGRSNNDGEVTDKMPQRKGDGFEGHFGDFMGAGGSLSFSSLLGSTEGHFSNFLDGPPAGLQMSVDHHNNNDNNNNNNNGGDGFLNIPGGDNAGGWSGGSNGWPDLSMYTSPGSNFL